METGALLHAVKSTHIPELEHVFRVDAEILHFGLKGGVKRERGRGGTVSSRRLDKVTEGFATEYSWDLLRLWKGPQSALQQQRSVETGRKHQ